ncbi:MAG: FliG C-terminal domain-containing protein [Planctomycetota bacterium]|jgi:flagellar motor switch protein FliG
MTLTGIQKAALLLTTLDTATATDLLKGQPQQAVQKIAMELSELDLKGKMNTDQATEITRQFCTELTRPKSGELHIKQFVSSLLQDSAGKEKAAELQNKMQQAVIQRDPYVIIADAAPVHLASVLQNESPQAIAIVLSEIPPKLGTEVLSRLDEQKAQMTVWRMAQPTSVSRQTVLRIGETVHKHLVELQSQQVGQVVPEEDASSANLRQIALVLGGLSKEKRDAFLKTIEGKDNEAANMVRALMVTWEDIPRIEDKSLQEILRQIEASVLAKALQGAEANIAAKINGNISERMKEMIEEEVSLMGTPKKKDILEAREEMIQPLRDANKSGDLEFIEEED